MSSANNKTETKQQVLDDLTAILGIRPMSLGVGSSVPSEMFREAAVIVGVPVGTMPEICEAIVLKAGHHYDTEYFDSRTTPSGGGSTVTLDGLKAMRNALKVLL